MNWHKHEASQFLTTIDVSVQLLVIYSVPVGCLSLGFISLLLLGVESRANDLSIFIRNLLEQQALKGHDFV
jgi:hypothetical protein